MQQHHAQVQYQVNRCRRPIELIATLQGLNVLLQRVQQLHQPGHRGHRPPKRHGHDIEQQPCPLAQCLPAALGVGHRLFISERQQQVPIGCIKFLVNVAKPEFDRQPGRFRTLRQRIGVDADDTDVRFAETTMVVDRPGAGLHPVKNTLLQNLRFTHVFEQSREAGIFTQRVFGEQGPVQQHQRGFRAKQNVHAAYRVRDPGRCATPERQRKQGHARRGGVDVPRTIVDHALQAWLFDLAVHLGSECSGQQCCTPFPPQARDPVRALGRIVQLRRDIGRIMATDIHFGHEGSGGVGIEPCRCLAPATQVNALDCRPLERREVANGKFGERLAPGEGQWLAAAGACARPTRDPTGQVKVKYKIVRRAVCPVILADLPGQPLTGVIGQRLNAIQC